MVEWHVTPDYIVNNWTDELLDLMVLKMIDRKQRESNPEAQQATEAKVSEDILVARSGGMIEVVKKHGD